MKKCLAGISVVVLVLLLASPGLFAQGNGAITGFIKDDAGGNLPGATITATSDVLPGIRTAISDVNGYYRLPALVPGKYQVVAELSGLNPVKALNIAVNIGAVVRLDFTLTAGAVTEEIVVTASAPVIEPERTTVENVITSDILNTMPILGRDFMNAIGILPGVVRAGDMWSISGGRDTDKNYNIDGMDNVDIAQGKAMAGGGYSLPTDKAYMTFDQEAIQELSVARAGYSADMGWGYAGFINVVTKSGSNSTHGSLYLDYRNNKLDFGKPIAYNQYYFGGSLGGPLVKDKLLFFLTFTPRYNKDAYDRRSWWMQDVPESLRQWGDNYGGFAKLTWLASEKHTLNLSSNLYKSRRMRNLTLYRAPGDYPEEMNYNDGLSLNANLTSIFSKKFLLNSQMLFATTDNRRRNQEGTTAGTSFIYDETWTPIFTGTYGDHDWAKIKFNLNETANVFIEDWGGRHTIVAGAEVRYNKQTDERVALTEVTAYPPSYGLVITETTTPYKWSSAQTYYAGYLTDKWSPVKNVIIEPGIRVSHNSFMPKWLFEPRLNLTYDPVGDGKTVIRGGANLYRDRINEYVQQCTNYPGSHVKYEMGGMVLDEFDDYHRWVADPNLTYPTTTELSIGVDRQLIKDMFISASYIYRKYEDQLFSRYINLLDPVTEERDDPTKGRLSLLTNSGYCNYKGIQLVLGKRLGQGWYQFLMSFTHQVSRGNSFLFLDFAQHQGIVSPEYKGDLDPADLYGRTSYDKPYDFKFYGSVKLPLDFMVATIFNITAGTPYTAYSYGTPPDYIAHFTSEYQALRSPQTWNIDLRVEKDFRIGKYNLRFKVDAFNLTNKENIYEIYANSDDPDYGMPYELGPQRRIQLGFRFDF